jgi:hypothetical protein
MADIREPLPAAIDVVQPYDVVLAEVASDLNLDQFEWNLARIGKPMNAPDGNVARLVFMHGAHVIASCDFSSSLHDHPMLRTVEMLLQRKHAPGLHCPGNSASSATGASIAASTFVDIASFRFVQGQELRAPNYPPPPTTHWRALEPPQNNAREAPAESVRGHPTRR